MKLSRYLSVLPVFFIALPALADNPMAGSWTVVEATVAPWVDAKAAKPELNSNISGAKFVFTTEGVQGPAPLGFAKAKFTVSTVVPEGLFQGGLKNPAKEATALGFKDSKITSVNATCLRTDADVEMDYALVDPSTALFGLDNVVYKMKRVGQ